jgi:hypothetical protein
MVLDQLMERAVQMRQSLTNQAEADQLSYAIEQVERRQRWITLYSQGDQRAVQFLEVVNRASRTTTSNFTPLDQYPEPGPVWIEDITNEYLRGELGLSQLEGPSPALSIEGGQPAIQAPTVPLAIEFKEPEDDMPGPNRTPPQEDREREALLNTMRQRAGLMAPGVLQPPSGPNKDYVYPDGKILRYHNSRAYSCIDLFQPRSAFAPRRKLGRVMEMQSRNLSIENEAAMLDMFDDAQILRPQTSRELAASRDNVLKLRARQPGTPIGSVAPAPRTPLALQTTAAPSTPRRSRSRASRQDPLGR